MHHMYNERCWLTDLAIYNLLLTDLYHPGQHAE